MKKLLFAISLLASLASRATTVDAYYIFTDFNVNTQQVRRVVQTPLQPFADYSGAILVPTPIVHTTDTNGYAAFSNTVAGYAYRISVDTPFGTTVRTSGYPVGLTGYVNGRGYLGDIHSMAFYYLYPTNEITVGGAATNVVWPVAGANITAVTNGLTVTISSTATGGGVGSPGRNLETNATTINTVTNPSFTSLLITNPAAGGSSATAVISGNTGAGGFSDTITSDPNALGFSLGGSRFVRMPKLVVSGSGASAMVGDGSGITNLVGNGVNITNVNGVNNPISYLNLLNLPSNLVARASLGNQKIMERLSSVLVYTNILPLASTNTVDTRLIDLLTNADYGTCIVLSNGTYNIGNAAVVMAPGVMMIGQSTSNAIVYKQGNGTGGLQAGITERRDCCLANFTFYESSSTVNFTSGLVVDSGTYSDNFGILAVNVVFLMDTDSGRFNSFNGEIETYNCWFESHWDGWVMDSTHVGSRALAYNNFHLNDVTKSIHSSPDGDRPLRTASYFKALYSTFVAKDTFNPGDADSICVGPCGPGVFLGDCVFSLTTTSDPAQSQVGQVFGPTTSMAIVSGGTYDASKFVNKVRILQ